MKKSLIALAVLAASGAAMAQSSVTLFGIVDTGFGYVKNSGGDKNYGLLNNGNVNSRLGFRGVEDLGGGLKAGFWLEGNIAPDTGATALSFTRRSTLSLMGGFGEVRLGRDLTPGYAKTMTYDVFGQAGLGQFLGWNDNLAGTAGDMNGIRASNMLAYYTPNFGGITGALGYGFGEVAGSNKAKRYVGGYAAYDNGPISVALALDKNNNAYGVWTNTDRTQWSLGGSYDLGMVKASAMYQRVKLDGNVNLVERKYNNWLLGVSAPVGPGTVKAQYASYDLKNSSADAHQLSLGYVYDMSKRTAVYGTVSFLNNKDGSAVSLGGNGLLNADIGRNQSGFQVGVRHAF